MTEAAQSAIVCDFNTASAGLTTRGAYRAIFVALGLACLTVWLFATSDLPWTSTRLWLAMAIVFVCALPVIAFAARPERWYLILPLVALAYMTAYGVPSFRAEPTKLVWADPIPESDYIYTCGILALGCSTLVVGMFMPVHRMITSSMWQWPSDDKLLAGRFAVAALIGGIVRVLNEATLVPEAVVQPALIIANMSEIGVFVVFALWTRKKASPLWCFVALAGILPTLFVGFGSSLLWNVVRPCLMFVVGYYGLKRRVPWVVLLVMFAFFVPANFAKHEFRYQLAEHPAGIFERPLLFAKVIWEGYTDDTMTFEDAGDSVTDRIDHLTLMAQVVSMTPEPIPYWEGETYKTLFYAPIPRFVMPDKPRKGLGQEFGHRYHFISDEDYSTSVNFAQLVEAYANFGPVGVGVGMFIIGLLYAIISALLERRDPPLVAVAVGSAIALGALNIESDFALVNGGLVLALPSLWVLMHVLCWNTATESGGV